MGTAMTDDQNLDPVATIDRARRRPSRPLLHGLPRRHRGAAAALRRRHPVANSRPPAGLYEHTAVCPAVTTALPLGDSPSPPQRRRHGGRAHRHAPLQVRLRHRAFVGLRDQGAYLASTPAGVARRGRLPLGQAGARSPRRESSTSRRRFSMSITIVSPSRTAAIGPPTIRLRRDVADHQTLGGAAEAAVGDQRAPCRRAPGRSMPAVIASISCMPGPPFGPS